MKEYRYNHISISIKVNNIKFIFMILVMANKSE